MANFIKMIAVAVAAGSLIACSPSSDIPTEFSQPAAPTKETRKIERPDDNTSQDIEQFVVPDTPELVAETPIETPALPMELSRYSTGIYDYTPGRLKNLEIACKAVEGYVIEPGAEFSFNEVVGPRTPEKGYMEATIFIGEEHEKQYGGGICQLSTTLYQAALAAGFEITERHEHSLPVDYIEDGMDATIYYGSLDFRFINTSQYPVVLSAMLADDMVTVSMTAI